MTMAISAALFLNRPTKDGRSLLPRKAAQYLSVPLMVLKCLKAIRYEAHSNPKANANMT